jgi:hypothetical protein
MRAALTALLCQAFCLRRTAQPPRKQKPSPSRMSRSCRGCRGQKFRLVSSRLRHDMGRRQRRNRPNAVPLVAATPTDGGAARAGVEQQAQVQGTEGNNV